MENLKPLRQSNFSTVCMSPRLPSCTRSSSGRSAAWYFLAIDTTRRRLPLVNVCTAASPARTIRCSSRHVGRADPSQRCKLRVGVASGLDHLGQPDLVVFSEQGVAADVAEVQTDQILVWRLHSLVRQWHPFLKARPERSGRQSCRPQRSSAFAYGSGISSTCCALRLPLGPLCSPSVMPFLTSGAPGRLGAKRTSTLVPAQPLPCSATLLGATRNSFIEVRSWPKRTVVLTILHYRVSAASVPLLSIVAPRLAAGEEKFAATRLHGPVMRRVDPGYTCSKLRQLLIGRVHALLRAI